MPETQELTLDISESIEIKAALGDAYKALIHRLTDESSTPDNKSMPMVLKEWPGGRWFRDLGNRRRIRPSATSAARNGTTLICATRKCT